MKEWLKFPLEVSATPPVVLVMRLEALVTVYEVFQMHLEESVTHLEESVTHLEEFVIRLEESVTRLEESVTAS